MSTHIYILEKKSGKKLISQLASDGEITNQYNFN